MKGAFKNRWAAISKWLTTKPQTKATWIMVLISCVMMLTLCQNCRVIGDSSRALQTAMQSLELQKIITTNTVHELEIEEETRLYPELECMYDPFGNNFVIRNVGTTTAENIFLNTSVFSVSSNGVFQLSPISGFGGMVSPPLEKVVLEPGQIAKVKPVYVPDLHFVTKFWQKYRGEILVRLYVEYEKTKPAYHRYSGHFNFTLNSNPEIAAQLAEKEMKGSLIFLTEEEKPSMQKTLDQFNAMPRDEFKCIAWLGPTNMQEFPFGYLDRGEGSSIGYASNDIVSIS
jgi:hypothetical protein